MLPIAVGVIKPLNSKEDPNVDLSYLLNCTEFFFIDFRKQEPITNFRLNGLLSRGGLTGKF